MHPINSRYLTTLLLILFFALLTVSTTGAQAKRDRTITANSSPHQKPDAQGAAEPLRFLRSSGDPLANTELWLLCYTDDTPSVYLHQQWLRTDAEGHPTTALPTDCARIAALHPRHVQPSGKADHGPAYTVYAASWRTSSRTPVVAGTACVLTCPASGDVTIRDEWPLILFHVVASVEWQPEPGSAIVDEIFRGLRAGSAYLADLTDGYMAFGPVTIYTDGDHWEGADLRFQAANDLRPAAFVGGMVNQTVTYSPTVTAPVTFRPAATFYGRGWDGRNAHLGLWDAPAGYRTIIHEWAHYALFLYDEYQGTAVPHYCTELTLPSRSDPAAASAMAFHYTASEFWHPGHGTSAAALCNDTDQARIHGHSDWETLAQWFDLQGLTISGVAPLQSLAVLPDPGPTRVDLADWGPLADLFARSPEERGRAYLPLVRSGAGTPLPSAPTFAAKLEVYTSDSPKIVPSQVAQVYLANPTAVAPAQLLFQGAPVAGSGLQGLVGALEVLGVHPTADLRVEVDRYTTAKDKTVLLAGGRFHYTTLTSGVPITNGVVIAKPNAWGSSLDLQFGMSALPGETPKLNKVKVILTGPRNDELSGPIAQLCSPDQAIGCPAAWRAAMVHIVDSTSNRWEAAFTPLPTTNEFPLYFVVQVRDAHPDFDGFTRWVRDLGGVGPGHKPGGAPVADAPQREGPATVDQRLRSTIPGTCNRVLAMPAADYSALGLPLPTDYQLVGRPLDIDILTGEPNQEGYCQLSTTDDLRLTLYFNQDEVDRLVVDVTKLEILQYLPGQGAWQIPLVQSRVNSELNWVEITVNDSGIYLIVAAP